MDSKEIAHKTRRKVHNDTVKIKKTNNKTQKKTEKDIKVERWIEEMVQLRLEMQIKKLHKNIQFFKQQNEYIRRLSEKCRCAEDMKGLQQLLPIRNTYTHGERLYLEDVIAFLYLLIRHIAEHVIVIFRIHDNDRVLASKILQ